MTLPTNLILKMSRSINHDLFSQIKTTLTAKPGIIDVMANLTLPYLMRVDYDPNIVTSQTIICIAKECDVDARIVGI